MAVNIPVTKLSHLKNTRSRLLEAAAERVHDRGFFRTTLDEIASDVKIAKATFYHHFKNKEQLGESLIAYNIDRFIQLMNTEIFSQDLSGFDRLQKLCNWTVRQFAEGGLTKGCPICNLVTELALESPKYRKQLFRYFEECTRLATIALKEAKQAGDLRFDLDAEVLAGMLVAQLEGHLLIGKASIGEDGETNNGASMMREGYRNFFSLLGAEIKFD